MARQSFIGGKCVEEQTVHIMVARKQREGEEEAGGPISPSRACPW
jgi:hypothetical protein